MDMCVCNTSMFMQILAISVFCNDFKRKGETTYGNWSFIGASHDTYARG